MSLDANYILFYENFDYSNPTPMQRDKEYLENKFGGCFFEFGCYLIYWEKPKYTLLKEEIKNLLAHQILEKKDGELWKEFIL